jgi:hypothetical protein
MYLQTNHARTGFLQYNYHHRSEISGVILCFFTIGNIFLNTLSDWFGASLKMHFMDAFPFPSATVLFSMPHFDGMINT